VEPFSLVVVWSQLMRAQDLIEVDVRLNGYGEVQWDASGAYQGSEKQLLVTILLGNSA